jgi:hypothetical protein
MFPRYSALSLNVLVAYAVTLNFPLERIPSQRAKYVIPLLAFLAGGKMAGWAGFPRL